MSLGNLRSRSYARQSVGGRRDTPAIHEGISRLCSTLWPVIPDSQVDFAAYENVGGVSFQLAMG